MAHSCTHVLLMPEDVEGSSPSQTPMYGRVTIAAGPTSTVDLLPPLSGSVQVRSTVVDTRQVQPEEHGSGAPGLWLRKPVVGISNGRYVYGQVVAYLDKMATIRSLSGLSRSRVNDLTEVAPVLCFLMANQDCQTNNLTSDDLSDQHHLVLDRLLGQNGQQATRAISRLLQGIIPPRRQPAPTDTLYWISSSSGTEVRVSVRHAVDYAYYIDGGRRIPSTQRGNLGSAFDQDPNQSQPQAASVNNANTQDIDDLDALLDAIGTNTGNSATALQAERLTREAPLREPPPERSQHVEQQPTQSISSTSHGKVLAAISNDPTLVRFYLKLCQNSSTKRPSESADAPSTQRRRLESPSDLFDVSTNTGRGSKHVFNPSQTQQRINRRLISPEHEGKPPSSLVDAMISSKSTKFRPHPAIITRVYDMEFRARGLSVMRFMRFDFAARRVWYADGSVNLNNFAATVSLPKAPKAKSLDDLSSCLTVLTVFAEEFFDQTTCRLLSSAREFVKELRGYCQWSSRDVETLTFWFDSVLEEYRFATEHDTHHGTSNRSTIRTKLSLQDADLQSVLYVIQTERLLAISSSSAKRTGNDTTKTAEPTRRGDNLRPNRKTPRDVIDALPRQGRLTVCMKYLSANGCSSRYDERCAYPNHAHFIPDELAPIVREHITKHLGGLRSELRQ